MICIKKLTSSLISLLFITMLSGCNSSTEPQFSESILDSEPTIVEEEIQPIEESSETISFYGVGDNLIHSQIIEFAQIDEKSYDFKPIYQNVIEEIAGADLSFINQESIIGGDDLGFTGYPSFNTPSDMAKNLVEIGFNIIGGSNNHSLDRGTAGVENTLNYWSEYKDAALFTGVFSSQEQRDTISTIEIDGVTFAVLTYTYGTNGIEPEFPYLVNYFDPDLITQDIESAKNESDFVVVSAHWGDEHALAPNQMQTEYAQLFADLEVDLVVGTHSHTIQPVEWLTGVNGNETLIIYSLGNFVASSTSDINMLGGSISLDFIKEDEDSYINNVLFTPLVIHYENAVEGNIDTRTDFEVFKLSDYPDEIADQHALNHFEDNLISSTNFLEIVREVIDNEFLE